jgi:hypothetical protein
MTSQSATSSPLIGVLDGQADVEQLSQDLAKDFASYRAIFPRPSRPNLCLMAHIFVLNIASRH